MNLFSSNPSNSLNSQLPTPSSAQLLLFLLLLGWLAAVPVGVSIITLFLPTSWPNLAHHAVAVILMAGLLLIPLAGFAVFVSQKQGWEVMRPLALLLLGLGFYILVDAGIRAVAGPEISRATYISPPLATLLRLTLLTLTALLLGGLGLWRVGMPRSRRQLSQVLGLTPPPVTGLLLVLAAAAILTIGWPLTGALGDSWASEMILIQTLARSLPEEIFFRGAIPGLLLICFSQRRGLMVLLALFTYLAFTPSLLVPYNDWGKLVLLAGAIPLTLLLIELRLLTGSIWSGLLLACCYRAAPLLFTDPRDELPFITQPWQTAAHLWMLLGAGALVLLLWAGQRWLRPRWRLSSLAATGTALVVVLAGWGVWLTLWLAVGRPGFYNDGFLIVMAEQADLGEAEQIDNLLARRTFVRGQLIETAQRTQAPVRQALDAAGLPYRPFYLINMIWVEGHHRRMDEFANLPGVGRVMLNPNVRPYPFGFDIGYGDAPNEGQGIAWNISQVQANQVWAMSFTGQGIVVAGQDTGYDWQHPALRRAYRGANNAGVVNHNYNWHDAWADTPAPFDDDQHGTHTMGTILGDDGQGNQIGIAPGAQWIGCRNMQRGLGNPASYTDCMEFFLAPYPLGGDFFTDGDVSQAPHVVNNSWGCPDIEGCDDFILEPAATALRAAGIMMVASAGNEGPACQTVDEPPARSDSVFSVGATNSSGSIVSFSSRGPVPVGADHDTRLLKPDISAPGADIRSSLPGGDYGTASGTSMAGPHVTGLVALIWSANPALIGQIDATEEIIRQSATPIEVTAVCALETQPMDDTSLLDEWDSLGASEVCACGDVTGSPNNVYGWGQINALRAVQLALQPGEF